MMTRTHSNIVLIGMPSSGKSTVGVILAKMTSRDFVDTDVLIQTSHRRTLQDIVDEDGYAALRKVEEDALLGLAVRNHVIATGGSAVYSDAANHLVGRRRTGTMHQDEKIRRIIISANA
ncbi:MAG: shikimate kinase [Syntrophaceae bacterium]|nr:MAG: shikimate kinase [Syntrophaceae bacterium]